MSAPGQKARSPAPRRITQRSSSSDDRRSMTAPRAAHIGLFIAFSLSGRLSTTVAIGPLRSTSIKSDMLCSSDVTSSGLMDGAELDQAIDLGTAEAAGPEHRDRVGAEARRSGDRSPI